MSATSDVPRLPSLVELGGQRPADSFYEGYIYLADVLNSEGDQYRVFSLQQVSARGANRALERQAGGRGCYWWIRTPSPDFSTEKGVTWFNRVNPVGDPFRCAAEASSTEPGAVTMPGFYV